jgi:hypothetical protein
MLRSAPLFAAWCAADPGSIVPLLCCVDPGSAEQREERCSASGTRAKTDSADNKTSSGDLPVGRFVEKAVESYF